MSEFKINKQKKKKLFQDRFKEQYMPKSNLFLAIGTIEKYKVAEISTNSGYYAEDLSKAVGPNGQVFSIDMNTEVKEIITYKTKGQKNITNILSNEAFLPLEANSIDLAICVDALHSFDDVELVMKQVHKILKPQSKLYIADYSPEYSPPPGPPKSNRIFKEDCRLVCLDVGFRYMSSWNLSIYHYGLMFQKK